jgi:hypothetical protein
VHTLVIPSAHIDDLAEPPVHHRFVLIVEALTSSGEDWMWLCSPIGMPEEERTALLKSAATRSPLAPDMKPCAAPPAPAPAIPQPRRPEPEPEPPAWPWTPPACLPNCVVDHTGPYENGEDGGWYCRTRAGAVSAGTGSIGQVGRIEVGTSRFVMDDPQYKRLGQPHHVTLEVPDYILGLDPAAARELAQLLLTQADAVEQAGADR